MFTMLILPVSHLKGNIVSQLLCVLCLVAQSCPTLVHGILQEGKLEWVDIPFSRGSSRPRVYEASSMRSNI